MSSPVHLILLTGVLLSVCSVTYGDEIVQRPLVLVPGILGSKLCDKNNNVVWGSATSVLNLRRLELPTTSADNELQPCGIIEEVQVLGPLWSVRAYRRLIEAIHSWGYKDNENFFVFAYDWRQSNFETAQQFDQFLKANVPPDTKVDIIAHSMGGIVSRVFLMDRSGSTRVNKVLYLGCPFQGSANTFGTMSVGWGALENLLAGKSTINRTILSFPSFLELLPKYDDCCYVRDRNGGKRYLNIYDEATWTALGWLTSPHSEGAAFARFRGNLHRSADLAKFLGKDGPSGVDEITFAGDEYSTRFTLGMSADRTDPPGWRFSLDRGDGTVSAWSAANNRAFNSLAGSLQSFSAHSTIFEDKWVLSELKRELLAIIPKRKDPIAGEGRPALSVQVNGQLQSWEIDSVDISAKEASILQDEDVHVAITIYFAKTVDLASGLFMPSVVMTTSGNTKSLHVTELTATQELEQRSLRFLAEGRATTVGIAEITVQLTPTALALTFVSVFSR